MSVTLDGTLIITTLIGAIVTVLLAYMAKTQGDIHKAVNTNYQASQAMLEDMRKQLVNMGQLNATLVEQLRGSDLAAARRDGVNEGILIPTPVVPIQLATPLPVAPTAMPSLNITTPEVNVAAPPNNPELHIERPQNQRATDKAKATEPESTSGPSTSGGGRGSNS